MKPCGAPRCRPATVSRLNKRIYGAIEAWRNRAIEGELQLVEKLRGMRLTKAAELGSDLRRNGHMLRFP
jgi:hypothetical protein